MFLPQKAEIFLSISLSIWLPPDRLIWSKTPSGKFTTKSAYKLLACNASANNPSNSNLSPQKSFWRGLWKLRVPNKVKHFAWRVSNEALPTMVNLARQQVGTIDQCNSCNSCPEDVGWFVGRSHSNNQIATKTQFWTFGSTKKVNLFFITQTQTFEFLSFEWWKQHSKTKPNKFFFLWVPQYLDYVWWKLSYITQFPPNTNSLLAHIWMFFFFVIQFPSLITHHLSLLTHHSKIPCLFGIIAHFPSLNIFHTIYESHTCHTV